MSDNELQNKNKYSKKELDRLAIQEYIGVTFMRRIPRRPYPDLRTYFRESYETQAEFAARINKTQSWVSKLVNGEFEPRLRDALVISEAANVPLESLVISNANPASLQNVGSDNE